MSQSGGLSADEVLAIPRQREESAAERPPEQVQAYREAAAVLVAVEDPERLQPVGGEPATGTATALLGADLMPGDRPQVRRPSHAHARRPGGDDPGTGVHGTPRGCPGREPGPAK